MNKLRRAEFFKKISLLLAGYFIIPKLAGARTLFKEMTDSVMNPYAIIDLHCHPSLKMYLLSKRMWKAHLGKSPGSNLIHMQEDSKELSTGNVQGMIAAHYLPEIGIRKDWGTVEAIWPLIKLLLFKTSDKVEHGDYSNFAQVNIMLYTLESQIYIVNEKLKGCHDPGIQFVIARSYEEFEQALDPKRCPRTIPIAHAIEGAHALGREEFPEEQARMAGFSEKQIEFGRLGNGFMDKNKKNGSNPYIDNLHALKERGVCMMTLGHFFENDLVCPVDGMSPDSKKIPGMCWNYDNAKDNFPLKKKVGVEVVKEMLKIGMIVDITHTTPAARDKIYTLNRENNLQRKIDGKEPRPLVFSHVGAQCIFEKHNTVNNLQHYGFYDVSDEDIYQISLCCGVMGVIPENFWLVGADTHMADDGFDPEDFVYGIEYIIETIQYINSKTVKQDYSNIGIGTDFDGLADNPADLYKASQLNHLIDRLRSDIPGIKEWQLTAITSGNARRLLKYGWGD